MNGEGASFGRVLRQLRTAAALSQEELANRAGLSLRGVSDLERGVRRVPHLATVRLLSDALALDTADREALLAAARPATPSILLPDDAACPDPLPAPLTAFIGRERELADLTSLLSCVNVRLVTLTGPGGVGKTRLALELAAMHGNVFDGGITFVPLAPVREAGLVAAAIAHAVGARETVERSPVDAVVAVLQSRVHLLVLDNFEQVVEAAPVIADLLAACPRLMVLVTSRQVLHISGERDYPLAPLPLPDAAAASVPEGLVAYAAVRLFAERAQAAEPGFVLTTDNASTVVAICRELDGLPLAIELAAARSKVLPPAALLPRLTRRLEILTTGARDAPPRQRTLRAAIGWSYDLLTEEEQILFRRLSVFAGGFTLEAAGCVGGGGGDAALLDLVAALADKSLLQPIAQENGEPRFGMLETILEFGLEQLAASGEEEAARNAHAAYFLTLAQRLDDRLLGPEQGRRLREMEREHDNFRAALNWTLARSDPLGLRLATALRWFWRLHGHLREGRSWLERALTSVADSEPLDRVQASLSLGVLVDELGDAIRARELYQGSLTASQAMGDREGVAAAAFNLGLLALDQGDFATARALLQESLTFSRERDDRHGIALSLLCLGITLRAQRDASAARPLYEESLALFRQVGDSQRVARVFHNLGLLAEEEGALEQADALLMESLALFRQVEHRLGIAEVLRDLGWLALARGDPTAAAARFAEGLSIFDGMGSLRGVDRILDGCACLAAGRQPVLALRLAGAASALRERTGSVLLPAEEAKLELYLAVAGQEVVETAAAWQAGRAMPYDQAVADAFAILGEATSAVEIGSPCNPMSKHGLSPRELEVLRLVAEGRSNREIAEALFISRRTATTHITHLFTKLGLDSRAAAAAYAVRQGLA